ncbi:T7SS effector LXG polymorphic toxin [Priestia megaterium]|uniref:T7SS effector LXG polymorphic toxin n=1 Tax=Priestia megaterium TaxID=1404 RepID=UPI00203EA23B|nr:T7SS effector LXG polymorphic toxin [Priestia megaterium]MCM3185620.1 T7SS effector LXG polymorphic toxin [Priestia megaterium]
MKTLDVDAFHENIQAILDSIKSQKEQIQGLISQVQAFSSLDDAFKGKGGEAIRSFYETGHASFLTLYHSLLTSYEARLTQITHALRSFEPSEDGYITQPFLQDTIPAHLNQTRNTTVSLVDQANAAIQKVSHLASVSALNDQGFLTEVEQAKNKADKTMNDLVRFDEQQTQSLSVIQDQLTSLNSLLSKVKAGFQNGSIQPGNVSELSALAKKAMTDSGGVSVFEKGIPTTLTRKEKQEKVIKEVGLEKLIQLQAMTPAEQLKEIHRLEKTSPYIREVLTQIQQDTAPANMKKLAELSPAEQAVELEKSPYLQALNDSSTVGMLTSQQILQNATGVEGMLMQSVMRQGQVRSVGTKKTAESFDFTEICENPKTKKEETGIKAVVKDVGEGAVTLAKGTVTGNKGVAQDFLTVVEQRLDKWDNSWYDFGNLVTVGGFDGAIALKEGLDERGEKSFDSPYDFVNHATMGLLDVGQQALNPDKPLSKEHWENSMVLFASIIGGAKPVGAVKAVPMVTNVPRVPAHKATKTLSDMRNVVSPKAASNWSKKVYEPVQKQLQPLLDAEIPTLRPQPQLVGIGEALPGKPFGEALNGLTTYKMGNVSKGQSKALEKVEKPDSKANVEGVYDQEAVAKGTGKVYPTRQIDSVAEAHIIDRVKELRGNLSSKYKKAGNFALAEVDVNSLNKKEFYASSKIDEFKGNLEEKVPEISLKPNEPIFEASLAPGKDGKPYMRDSDTEYKILNEIALKLGNDVNATGEIKLFTELDTCDSCSKVIAEFADKYKNIKLEVIHNNGERLKP